MTALVLAGRRLVSVLVHFKQTVSTPYADNQLPVYISLFSYGHHCKCNRPNARRLAGQYFTRKRCGWKSFHIFAVSLCVHDECSLVLMQNHAKEIVGIFENSNFILMGLVVNVFAWVFTQRSWVSPSTKHTTASHSQCDRTVCSFASERLVLIRPVLCCLFWESTASLSCRHRQRSNDQWTFSVSSSAKRLYTLLPLQHLSRNWLKDEDS